MYLPTGNRITHPDYPSVFGDDNLSLNPMAFAFFRVVGNGAFVHSVVGWLAQCHRSPLRLTPDTLVEIPPSSEAAALTAWAVGGSSAGLRLALGDAPIDSDSTHAPQTSNSIAHMSHTIDSTSMSLATCLGSFSVCTVHPPLQHAAGVGLLSAFSLLLPTLIPLQPPVGQISLRSIR